MAERAPEDKGRGNSSKKSGHHSSTGWVEPHQPRRVLGLDQGQVSAMELGQVAL